MNKVIFSINRIHARIQTSQHCERIYLNDIAEVKKNEKMAGFGAMATSLIGICLGMSVVIAGSFFTWQADKVLGVFSRSGWHFDNLVAGDGKITLTAGIICLVFLGAGAVFKNRTSYALAIVFSVFCLVFSIYELIVINSKSALLGTGPGVYLVGLGGVIGLLSSICGFFIVKGEYTGPQMNIP